MRCEICPRRCNAERTAEKAGGVCRMPAGLVVARAMLHLLSGRTHEVVTVLTVCCGEQLRSEPVVTRVTFRALTDEEIRAYIATGEPMDKAGSYGIQGYGAMFVSHLEGDYFSVMGRPLCPLCRMLRAFGVSILTEKEAQEA